VQLLWPLTTQEFGTSLSIKSQTNIALEWIIFLTAMIIMVKTKDIGTFFQPRNSNLILLIPTSTVLLPTFLSYPLGVPALLILPHLVYLILFAVAIIIVLLHRFKL
jgi:hypothetical protein